MKRIYKNIICIAGIIIGSSIIFGVLLVAKNNLQEKNIEMINESRKDDMMPPSDNNRGRKIENLSSEEEISFNNDDMKKQVPQEFIKESSVNKLTIFYIIPIIIGALIISTSLLYLIFSLFGKNNVFINTDKIIIYTLSTVILTSLISYISIYYTNNYILMPTNKINTNQVLPNNRINKDKNQSNSI